MRQTTRARIFFTGLVIFLLLSMLHCGPDKPSNEEVAEQLLTFLNGNLPGSHIKTDLKRCTVKPVEKNRYFITLRDCIFTTDLTRTIGPIYKNMVQKENIYKNADTARIEEMVILFDPDEKMSSLESMKGFTVEIDMSAMVGEYEASGPNGLKLEKMYASIGKAAFSDLIIKEMKGNGNVGASGAPRNPAEGVPHPFDSKVEDIKLEMTGAFENGEKLWALVALDEIESVDEGLEDPYATLFIFEKDAPPPDLSKILREGRAINDLVVNTGKITISIKKNGKGWGNGSVDNVTYTQFLKPDETGASFRGGHGFKMKNLHLSIPEQKEVEPLSRVKEIDYQFSAERISQGAVLAFFDLLKTSYQWRDLADQSNTQQFLFKVMKLQNEFFKSKSPIKFSISPLKHDFGEMDARANIRLAGLLSPPDLKLRVDLPKIDKTLENLRAANVLAPPVLKKISETVDAYAVRKENGNAAIDIELKSDHPGVVFINGKPGKIGKRGF